MSNVALWVTAAVVVALVVVPLSRTAWRLLSGEDELVAGGSWGRQLLGRKGRPRKRGPGL